jgi:hypothetical protein
MHEVILEVSNCRSSTIFIIAIYTSSKCLDAASKLKRPAKGLTTALLIAAFSVIIFAVPFLIGKEISPELSISAFSCQFM